MKKLAKLLTLLLAVTALCFTLTACGGGSNPNPTTTPSTSTTPSVSTSPSVSTTPTVTTTPSGTPSVAPSTAPTEVTSEFFTLSGTTFSVTVPNSQATLELSDKFNIPQGVSAQLYKEMGGVGMLLTSTNVSLNEGENVYALAVTMPTGFPQTYAVVITRNPTYAVHFNTQGSSVETQYVENGFCATQPTQNPTRAGYTFTGWDYDFTTPITQSITINAQWQGNQNTLKFEGNGATSGSMQNMQIRSGATAVLTANGFTKTGYTFLGWATSANGSVRYQNGAEYTMGTESEYTLYAVWQGNLNTLRFNGNGATSGSMANMQIRSGATATLTANAFSRTGYTFVGWSTTPTGTEEYENRASYTMGTESEYTLYAVWQGNLNTLKFNGNGATSGTMQNMQIRSDATATLSANAFSRAGYTFVGWATSASGAVVYENGASYTMGTNNTYTLYAVWQANLNSLSFNPNGATAGNMQLIQIRTGESATLPSVSFTKTGYTFLGWATSAEGTVVYENGETYTMGTESEYTLYAKWELIENVITFNGNGATGGEMATQTVYKNGNKTLNNNAFTKTGYTFAGWAESAEGFVKYQNGATVPFAQVEGYTLYAVWQEPYTEGLSFTKSGDAYYVNYYNGTATTVTIPAKYMGYPVTSIGSSAFSGCDSLTEIVIPNSVTSIGSSAFLSCDSLTEIVIPEGVTSIGSGAFYYCSSLTTVNYLGTIDQWAQISFGSEYANPMYYAEVFQINGKEVTEITLTTATKISNYAFCGFNNLTKVTIPKSVTSIGSSAFYYCSSLTTVRFGDNSQLTSIGSSAFRDCDSLTEIVIPNSVTSIGGWVFFCCISLTEIVIPASVTSIGECAFASVDTIYCEVASKPRGWDSKWNRYDKFSEDIIPTVWGYTGE